MPLLQNRYQIHSKSQKMRMEDNPRVKDAHEFPPFTIQISTSASIFLPFNCCKHPNFLIMMQTPPTTSPIFDNWQPARMITFVGADSIWSLVITPTMQAMMPVVFGRMA